MTKTVYENLKRAVDIALTGSAFVMTLPAQGVIALLVARHLGRPVLFRQTRPGYGGQPFVLVKFRTMRPIDTDRGWVDDASRLTTFGRTLRSTSLDELPTLWNVVRGDMSLVGPRPLLMHYLVLYSATQARRHEVRPGLTGLAQIAGRNLIDWDERLRLDVEYVDRRSLRLDLLIVLRTVSLVFRREGITGEGQATMTEFTSSDLISRRPK